MTAANKFLITTESREFVILHRGRNETRRCEGCGGETVFVGVDEAVAMSGCGALSLLRSALEGRVHLSESDEGLLLVCAASLSAVRSIEGWDHAYVFRS